MSDASDMTDAQRVAAVKIEKLLRLGKSPNPAEAQLAMEKAQEIALANNLSMALEYVGEHGLFVRPVGEFDDGRFVVVP